MLQSVKLQNVMLQMNLDMNIVDYPEFSAIGKDYRSPFVYDSDKKCHIVEKLDKVNFIILAPRYIPKRCYNFILAWPI